MPVRAFLHKVYIHSIKQYRVVQVFVFPDNIEQMLSLVRKTRKELMLVTPYYDVDTVTSFLKELPRRVKLKSLVKIPQIPQDTEVEALEKLFNGGEVRHAEDIHAKVMIFDRLKAIVSSLNLSGWNSGNLGVLLENRNAEKVFNVVSKWWRKSKPLSEEDMVKIKNELKRKAAETKHHMGRALESPAVTNGKIRLSAERHLIINVNWNPYEFEDRCRKRDVLLNKACHLRYECLKQEYYKGGCASCWLFRNYQYATRKEAIRKGRLVFFIAKNPKLNHEYYFVGCFWLDGNAYGKAWSKNLYWFGADSDKSIKFSSEPGSAITVKEIFGNALGEPLRGNPTRIISNEKAVKILEEYHKKTEDRIVKYLINLIK
jgi:hypothetical protein